MSLIRPKLFDKKYKIAEQKVFKIISKIESFNLNNAFISQLECPGKNKKYNINFKLNSKYLSVICFCVILFIMVGAWYIYTDLSTKNCVLDLPSSSKSLFRPPEDCSMCVGVDEVVRLSNITAKEFEENYAYKSVPVIVTDATVGWKAIEEFNFKFFADFYNGGKMGQQTNDCFYFAYKSGLNSLSEVFSMDEKRANLTGDPWYVGWSTCYDEETRRLRSYYSRPYFLPRTAESDMVDWVFMGGPGQGAHMHVDSVRHVSWQAQIRGRKQWQLAPPPECFYHCRWITFTVGPGEILVVDTNRWYHKTNVLPGDISITIGAEYD
ncbi:uncharacterized protein LOC126367362 [Pectinophora gossypiella]|uniref:uncharacterized protein LOC126367362 n=1 Tax=Pectinophora gossypiella TaxID=13191 RepID=UPI00214EC543|nr:uncharacterized protein LOC126367362 [Pectinophora gossypiella]